MGLVVLTGCIYVQVVEKTVHYQNDNRAVEAQKQKLSHLGTTKNLNKRYDRYKRD